MAVVSIYVYADLYLQRQWKEQEDVDVKRAGSINHDLQNAKGTIPCLPIIRSKLHFLVDCLPPQPSLVRAAP